MKRKLIKRNKAKYKALYKISSKTELRMQDIIELKRRMNISKAKEREEKRHGVYKDYDNIKTLCDDFFTFIPVRSKKNHKILYYTIKNRDKNTV